MIDNALTLKKPRYDFTADTLPLHPLFEGFGLEFRQILADCAMRTDFADGESVVHAGEPASGFYLVIQGAVVLEAEGIANPTRVQTVGAGDILGWSWLFPPYFWHFNGVAEGPTQTIFFYGTKLRQQCDRNRNFGYDLIKNMSQILISRLRTDRERWIEAAHTRNASEALSDYLII